MREIWIDQADAEALRSGCGCTTCTRKHQQDAMQVLANALTVILEFHDKCGLKALDDLGQQSFDIFITEARAALKTAQPFVEKK